MHYCYQNGEIKPIAEAYIHVTDLALLRGYGLFDYFRTYNGKPFQWDLYWTRFENSAKKMEIALPISKDKAYQVVTELVAKSGLEDCAIRFLLTGGYSANSLHADQPNLLILSENIAPIDQELYTKGISVLTYDFVRDISSVKSTDYKHLLIMQKELKKQGKDDLLFHKNGEVSELTRSNIFHFKDNVLITPANYILNGITRQTVLKLAQPHFKIEERAVSLEELLNADECFTTSSTKRILPVTRIDDQIIGGGTIGSKTSFLLKLINEMVKNW